MEAEDITTKGCVGGCLGLDPIFKCPLSTSLPYIGAGITGTVIPGVLIYLDWCKRVSQTWGLKQQKSISPQFWRSVSDIKVSAGLVPSEGCDAQSVPSLSPTSVGLLEICNCPWLTDTSLWPLSSSSHGFLPEWVCLCLNSPLYKDASHVGLRFQCDLILTNHLCSDPVFK